MRLLALSRILLLVLTGISGYSQQNLYVSTEGSDQTGNGSRQNPFQSLQKAADLVQPGDTVFVFGGTYRNALFDDGDIWEGDNLLKITRSGAPGRTIVFMPFPGDHVLLESDAGHNILIDKASYIKITGFEVKGNADRITQSEADAAWGLYKDANGVVHDLAEEMGIDINDPGLRGTTIDKPATPNIRKPSYYNGRGIVARNAHHIVISNNTVHDMTGSGIRADKSDYVTIADNEVYFNTYWTSAGVGALTVAAAEVRPSGDSETGIKIKLLRNYVHHNENRLVSWNPTKSFIKMVIDEGAGLFLTRNSTTYTNGKIWIANNISAYNGASGIVSHKTNRVLIEHNTCYKNGTTNDSASGGIGVNEADDIRILNNISYAEPDHWALGKLGGTLTNIETDSNILYNENGTEPIHRQMPDGWTETNPLLVDPENGDFGLNENSPAVNNGNPATGVTDDFNGNPRDDGQPDIGALEFGAELSVPLFEVYGISMYPNPAKERFYLKGNPSGFNSVKLYDLTGKMVLYRAYNANPDVISVDVSQLPSGVYIVRTACCSGRLIKE